ncbi:hypothetical protein J4526_01495 [Desulfurococcaceae archaeon MEX13E-LK6-19]|nr:hypothetical protein J4526_01495 [Desulfurococcaceae archaeon MEX13E-LK6-19]
MMITQREVLEVLREIRPFSETSFRRYVIELLEALDDRDLEKLIVKYPSYLVVSKQSFFILQKRQQVIE